MIKNRRRGGFNILYLILAAFFAVFLWLYVMGVRDPVKVMTYNDLPVTITGQDVLYETNGFTVMGLENSTVSVSLSGKRSDILKVKRENIKVEADLSSINSAGINYVQCTVTAPDNALTVDNLSNVRLGVNVDELVSIPIPVKLMYSASELAENEIVGTTSYSPETITVEGAKSELAGVAYAMVNKGEVDESFYGELPYTFTNVNGEELELQYAKTVTDKVNVSIPIYVKKEIMLEAHITDGNGLTKDNVDITITPSVITIAGERSALASIDSITVKDIDLADISRGTTTMESISLDEGIINLSQISSVAVKIALVNVSERTMIVPTTNVEIINPPPGFDVLVQEASIQITIWGGNSVISALKNENIKLIVDLNGFNGEGIYDVNVAVSFEGLEVAPRISGSYSLHVIISEPEPEQQ